MCGPVGGMGVAPASARLVIVEDPSRRPVRSLVLPVSYSAASHTRTVPSWLAESRMRPSAVNWTADTRLT